MISTQKAQYFMLKIKLLNRCMCKHCELKVLDNATINRKRFYQLNIADQKVYVTKKCHAITPSRGSYICPILMRIDVK